MLLAGSGESSTKARTSCGLRVAGCECPDSHFAIPPSSFALRLLVSWGRSYCGQGPGVIFCRVSRQTQSDAPAFRADVRQLWDEFQRLGKSREFGNLEGGSVEQQRDRRLQLHHCANYAAVLAVLRQTGQTRPLRLLELGCGSGMLTNALARVMPEGWTIEATDYSEPLLAGARARFESANLCFRHLDVRSIGPERLAGVDAVLLLEVIEHLPQDEAVGLLGRVYDALPGGGVMVMTTLDRAAFPRAFSGYAPHFIEYTHRSLSRFLRDRRFSPFEGCDVFRLVSPRIVGEAVRAEGRGGYLVNRFQRLLLSLGRRHTEFSAFRGWLESRLFRLYTVLPETDGFDFEGYLSTLEFIRSEPELRDRDSFGLVAVLKKAGGAVVKEEMHEGSAGG
jgi:2-polyprenyl-3-methyl-5-hydroxy-6-metoxy-1,4-benzoquinol methylase